MSTPTESAEKPREFSVELDEIEATPKEWVFPIRRVWLAEALAGSELSVADGGQEGRFTARLSRVGEDVYAETHIEAVVFAQCARCLEDAQLEVDVRGKSLLTREPIPTELTEDELGPDAPLKEALEGDEVVFDGAVREQILLETPMKPLCRPDCEGIAIPEHVRGPDVLHPDGSGQKVDPRLAPLMNIQQKLAEGKE